MCFHSFSVLKQLAWKSVGKTKVGAFEEQIGDEIDVCFVDFIAASVEEVFAWLDQ